MKKILLITVLLLGIVLINSQKLVADMTGKYTQVRAQHILVKTEDEAKNLKTDIENGKITFEDAAKQYSQCPSGTKGGDLGFFGRGMMVKEFEDASFNSEKGKVSNPVQTQFGWHLIKVTDKK